MKSTFKLKSTVTALGAAMALTAGSAVAGITWTYPLNFFEDDDIDFFIDRFDPDGVPGQIDVGDQLVAIFELNDSAGAAIDPDELTGISAIEVIAFADLDGGGVADDIIFGPVSQGLNAYLGGNTVTGGGAGGGAMLAMYLDPGNDADLKIDFGSFLSNTESCNSLATCTAQAVNGNLLAVSGFAGDGDESWVALNAQRDTNVVVASNGGNFATVNAALSILDDQSGRNLSENVPCSPFCGTGGGADGLVGMTVFGSIQGGLQLNAGLKADGAVGFSDFDMFVAPIPEPSSLALLACGFLGLGAWGRSRRRHHKV